MTTEISVTSAREIAELVQRGIPLDDATELIARYGALCASAAARDATKEAFDQCITLISSGFVRQKSLGREDHTGEDQGAGVVRQG